MGFLKGKKGEGVGEWESGVQKENPRGSLPVLWCTSPEPARARAGPD